MAGFPTFFKGKIMVILKHLFAAKSSKKGSVMSKYTDMLFWVVMTLIIVAIGFLSYITFFSPPPQSKTENTPERLKAQKVQTLYVCDDEAKIRSLPKKNGKIIQTAKKR